MITKRRQSESYKRMVCFILNIVKNVVEKTKKKISFSCKFKYLLFIVIQNFEFIELTLCHSGHRMQNH